MSQSCLSLQGRIALSREGVCAQSRGRTQCLRGEIKPINKDFVIMLKEMDVSRMPSHVPPRQPKALAECKPREFPVPGEQEFFIYSSKSLNPPFLQSTASV